MQSRRLLAVAGIAVLAGAAALRDRAAALSEPQPRLEV